MILVASGLRRLEEPPVEHMTRQWAHTTQNADRFRVQLEPTPRSQVGLTLFNMLIPAVLRARGDGKRCSPSENYGPGRGVAEMSGKQIDLHDYGAERRHIVKRALDA